MENWKNLFGFFVLLFLCTDLTSAVFWDDLRVTFSLNWFAKYGFNKVERTKSNVSNYMNWTPLFTEKDGEKCVNKVGSFEFRGFPMSDPMLNDKAVVTLYDILGAIAGIQIMMPHDEIISPKLVHHWDKIPMIQNMTVENRTYFVITAYFIKPDLICSQGRSAMDLEREGTGRALYIQNGATPDDLVTIPLRREDASKQNWDESSCVSSMGYHSFYNLAGTSATDCRESRPIFLLFDRNLELHGLGIHIPGTASSPRFEHPPNFVISKIIGADKIPKCFLETNSLVGTSSIHIWFISQPQLISCPWW